MELEKKLDNNPENDFGKDQEIELANEIHIFTSGTKKGIMFYDRTPSEVEQELTGTVPEGVYHTNKGSIEHVEWNDEINSPNTSVRVHYINGSNTVTTYIVSPQKFAEIIEKIKESIEAKEDLIIIDARENKKSAYKYINSTRNIPNEISQTDKELGIIGNEVFRIKEDIKTLKEKIIGKGGKDD